MVELPKMRNRRRTERVLDTRMCVINRCPFLMRGADRNQEVRYSCGAGVFRAYLPADPLHDYIEKNPEPVAGYDADDNPFLLRLLMAKESLRPECGAAEIEYYERVLEVDPDEMEADLFA